MTTVKLALPADLKPETESAVRLIRYYYEQQLGLWLQARQQGAAPRIASVYDRPASDKRYCIWYEILRSAENRYNPLWAINFEFSNATITNRPVNPETIKGGKAQSDYIKHGGILHASRQCELAGTEIAIKRTLPTMCKMYSLSPQSAINQIAIQSHIEPVVELCWWDSKRLKPRQGLVVRARVAYALTPLAYAECGFDPQWLQRRRLQGMFAV